MKNSSHTTILFAHVLRKSDLDPQFDGRTYTFDENLLCYKDDDDASWMSYQVVQRGWGKIFFPVPGEQIELAFFPAGRKRDPN